MNVFQKVSAPLAILTVNLPLAILHEDADCLAVIKPAGQFTQGSWAPPGESTLEQSIRHHLNPRDPSSVYVGVVHRLDRPTSGVLVWAKNPKSARRLAAQFERRQVVKEYWAIVQMMRPIEAEDSTGGSSIPANASTPQETWCDWLTRAGVSGIVRSVEPDTPVARQAVTRVRRAEAMAVPPGCSWLQLWPQTGRTHQLRSQAAVRGMPILGDRAYGSTSPFESPHGIALHARTLIFRHPTQQTEMRLDAPLPPEWEARGIILIDEPGSSR